MEIAPTGNNLGAPSTIERNDSLTDASSGMGRDEFLKLLTTQIENQDPLDPLKNHEFVAQLAQFSALEQQIATNETLGQIQMSQMSLSNAQLTDMIGKDIVARGDTVQIANGNPQEIGVLMPGPASKVNVTVSDENGNAVATFTRDRVSAGYQELTWNGVGADGRPLPDGRYRVAISAVDSAGNPMTIDPMTRGVVDAITFENGYAELLVGNARVVPGDVLSIHDTTSILPPPPPPPPDLESDVDEADDEPDPPSADNPRSARADSPGFIPDGLTETLAPPPWLLPPAQ